MPRLYSINPALLTDLTIADNVYLLGRIWADGTVCKNKIELYAKEGDAEHMFPFLRQMGVGSFLLRQRHNADGTNFGKPSYSICINRTVLASFLYSLDYGIKSKAAPTKVLALIDPLLHPLFWRGYFDGDGCLYMSKERGGTKLAFWSTIEQDWSELIKVCDQLKVKWSITKYERKGGKHCSSTFQLFDRLEIKTFLDWLYASYQLDKLGLTRKEALRINLEQRILTQRKPSSQYRGVSYVRKTHRWHSSIWPTKANKLTHAITCACAAKTELEAFEKRQRKIQELNINDTEQETMPLEKTYRS